MRLVGIILLFVISQLVSGQSDPALVLSPETAVSLAIRNNPTARLDEEKKILRRDVRSVYFSWLYQISKLKVIRQQLLVYHDIDRVASLRYQTGDIELQEKMASVSLVTELGLSESMLSDEIEMTKNRLRQLLYVDQEMVPADTTIYMVRIIKQPGAGPLTGVPAGGSEKAGLAPKHGRTNQEADTLRTAYLDFVRDKTIENLVLELNNQFKMLQYYYVTGLVLADQIIQSSSMKLNREDIDYPEFIREVATAFQIKNGYLKTIEKYNQTAIQLEFYAY
jgi:hypothetical protein